MPVWTAGLTFALLLAAVAASPIVFPRNSDPSYRLNPDETPTPVSYVVKLTPDIENSAFTGQLTLTVIPEANTKRNITLHAKDIVVNSVSVIEKGGNEELYSGRDVDKDRDFLIITVNKDLEPSKQYVISIGYSGILHNDMYGFYKSTYVDDDGQTRSLAATQFQPTHARKAFPCFDEPRYKATFKISISTPNGYHSLCNTEEVGRTQEGDRTVYEFKETPIMSTYLVAFVVSDFESLNTTKDEILYKTWARSNAISSGKYSIEVTPGLLQSLETYTGILYNVSGLTKVDQVALPDFSAGAMENWGLITYRERALLYTAGVSTASAKQTIATIIAHELAHMWFGNLVTTAWWDSTWLNEGFATYFENYIASKVEEDMRIMDQFVPAVHQTVFASDSLQSAHALTSECNTPAEVTAMFSSITYSKGGSILRMLNHTLTETKFMAALNNYLMAREFNWTEPSYLMEHLSAQATGLPEGVDFTAVVESWTAQPGFPVVKVERNYDDKSAHITQSRFLLNSNENAEPEKLLYHVPLNWATQKAEFEATQPKAWLTGEMAHISNVADSDKWVIFNVQETGFYRVNYDDKNWQLIAAALKSNPGDIHLLNRAQILDDVLNLARAGQLSYSTVLTIADYLVDEQDYIPWLSALNGLSFLNRRVAGHSDYQYFKNYVLGLLTKVYTSLGFKDEGSHVDKLHRRSVLTWACNMDHKECLQSATEQLEKFVSSNGTEAVKPDLQSVVYCYGLKNSNNDTWQFLWERYTTSNDPSEKTLLLSSLGCSNDKSVLQSYLQKSIEDGEIRRQDAASVFSAVYGNPNGVDTALEFLSTNFDKISSYYGSMGGIGNIVRGLAAQITTKDQQSTFDTFLEAHKSDLGAVVETASQTVTENLAWSDKFQEEIFSVLKQREDNGGGGSSMVSPGLVTFLTALMGAVAYLL